MIGYLKLVELRPKVEGTVYIFNKINKAARNIVIDHTQKGTYMIPLTQQWKNLTR